MKVVLFCGGLGTRLREHSDTVPKSLITIGSRPIIWHLMRYYAHHGHNDFVLCLGYRGDLIREYFLNYNEAMSNDFTLSLGGKRIELHGSDIDDWRITFVDTGINSNIGQRLLRVRRFVEGEEMFLANYTDGLSDLPLDRQIDDFRRSDAVACFASVPSSASFHAVRSGEDGVVQRIGPVQEEEDLINGGYFVFRPQIFDHIQEGEEIVDQPFARLIQKRQLTTMRWKGFWQCMDTFKDKIRFDQMEADGHCPWKVWLQEPPARRTVRSPALALAR